MSEGILVHEWLERSGGSENVFEALIECFPTAQRWCLWDDSGGRFEGTNETALARTPLRGRKALATPFMPLVWRRLPERDADWILASSHLFSHHARFGGTAKEAARYVYVHTPARYLWVPELDSRGKSISVRLAALGLRPLDRARAAEAHSVVANSQFVAERVSSAWGLQASVIYPPVDTVQFSNPVDVPADVVQDVRALAGNYVLGLSRFVPYKRLEVAIRAGRVAGLPVVLAGSGPEESRLRALADEVHPGQVHFVMNPSDGAVQWLFQNALVTIFVAVEDFGIVPVESMAAGTPVVVNAVGGSSESVLDGLTGVHLSELESDRELKSAVDVAARLERKDAVARAQLFSRPRFHREIREWVGA